MKLREQEVLILEGIAKTPSALWLIGASLDQQEWWRTLARQSDLLRNSMKGYFGGLEDDLEDYVSKQHAERLRSLRDYFISWYGVIQNQRAWEMVRVWAEGKNYPLPKTPGDCLVALIHLFFEAQFNESKLPYAENSANKNRKALAAMEKLRSSALSGKQKQQHLRSIKSLTANQEPAYRKLASYSSGLIAIARGGCRKKDRALIAALARFDASERELLDTLKGSMHRRNAGGAIIWKKGVSTH